MSSTRPGQAAQQSGDRVIAAENKPLTSVSLVLDANVDEADGLPASIPFGPKASLVNLDHVRLRDVPDGMGIEVSNAIHPVTRRCGREYVLYDEGSAFPNRFVMLADSIAACRDVQGKREGDLVLAEGVPEQLRQAVREVYDPVASRIASRLGSEVGMVFVAMWPDSPHTGYRFEPSWGRNSLLLFNGTEWHKGLDPEQRDALRSLFVTEQIRRRIGRSESMDPFSDSAARYLEGLLTREQAGSTNQWLADALPSWVSGCDRTLKNPARVAAARGNVPSVDCGLLVQFVYDAVARAGSGGRSLYDIWRSLLGNSYRRGESGAQPTDFLASSAPAQRIVKGLLDGTVDWTGFAAELDASGARLSVNQDASGISVSVLALHHFPD